jgi:cyclomaltodextrinase / maltogenic alpha-amylase / neopullulanase
MKNFLIIFFSLLSFTFSLAQVIPGDSNAVKVEFRFYHELAATDSGVGINGSFNNWVGGVYRMHELEPNWWFVTLELAQYGYEYKFVTYTDTVGQSGVTGYFTDPLNPRSGGPFNNSIVTVKDPMIYYLLPKTGTTAYTDKPEIMANISFANSTDIDLNRISFRLDNEEIPNAVDYYNPQTRRFSYTPLEGLPFTEHTVELKVFNTDGDSAVGTTTFNLETFFSNGPFTFVFDSKSPSFDFPGEITRVDAKGSFNSWGSTPMTDPDSSGVYKLTTDLGINEVNEYTYVINSGLYINDPDNPDLTTNYQTYVVKRFQLMPYFKGFNLKSGRVYSYPTGTISISNTIAKNDSGVAIDTASLKVKVDGNFVPITKVPSGPNWIMTANIDNADVGRHIVEFLGSDFRGRPAEPVTFVFGVYPENSGFNFVDGEGDDVGPGSYIYPNNIPNGSADISRLQLTAVPTMDSLEFTLKMKNISFNTRIGFYIVNSLNGEFVMAPANTSVEIPEWNNVGVYFTIAPSNSGFFDPLNENIVFISRDPLQTSYQFSIDSSIISSNEISFKIPLNILQSELGTFRSEWYFGAYSYLKDQNGTINVGEDLGGQSYPENPNIYDAAFMNENKYQARTLSNFIPASGIGGPRVVTIGSLERGSFEVFAAQIDTSLSNIPEIKIYASGGDLFSDTVRVTGFADSTPGSSVTLHINSADTTVTLDTDQLFQAVINLSEGQNHIYASIQYGNGLISQSPIVTYNRIVNHTPKARIQTSVSGNFVTMDADSSYDPDGGVLSFVWEQDITNPAPVSISGINSQIATFTAPDVYGEYYFTLKANASGNRTGWARTVIVVSDTGTFAPDYTTWHPAWVDTQVVYSIFVRSFSSIGNLNAVTEKLPQLKDLGINTIWFLPIHPTTNNIGPDNPGYAITDYYNVVEDYGTNADFKNLVNVAHQNGIRIVMDHVIQHTSILHPFMKDANVYKQYSPYYPFYMWDSNNNFIYLFTWVDLPSINFEEESTRNYLLNMAEYWVEQFNVDGFRSDVAWAINDLRPSGPAYWQRFRKNLKAVKPDIFLLAEADSKFPRYFDKKFDAAYDWSWFNNVKSIFGGSGSIDSLNAAIEYYYNPQFPKDARPFKFLENQDEQRFIEAFGLGASKLAASLLFSSPGIPMLYAGQEVGELTFRGIINWNDPNNLRQYYKKLVGIRNLNPALNSGDFTRVVNSDTESVYSFLRTKADNNVIALFNFGNNQVTTTIHVPLDKISFDSTETFYLNDVLNNQAFMVVGSQLANYEITIEGMKSRILVLSYTPITNIDDEEEVIPLQYELSQNFPNPFNPSTTIRYSLPYNSIVKILVYNILGEQIAYLLNGEVSAGFHEVSFNANRYASGVYFYYIEAKSVDGKKDFTAVKKMILLK